jgi:uncharacterized membrane protein
VTERRLRGVAIVLSLLGIGVAGYLTYVHYAELSPVCVGGGGGCAKVQASDQSELLGVPVALLGLLGYAALLAALALDRREAAALVAMTGAGFSGWLTYVEVEILEAICVWCVASAVCMGVLAVLSAVRLVAAPGAGS